MSNIAEADKYANLNQTVMNMLNKPSFGWWAIFVVDLMFLAFGIFCFIISNFHSWGSVAIVEEDVTEQTICADDAMVLEVISVARWGWVGG